MIFDIRPPARRRLSSFVNALIVIPSSAIYVLYHKVRESTVLDGNYRFLYNVGKDCDSSPQVSYITIVKIAMERMSALAFVPTQGVGGLND